MTRFYSNSKKNNLGKEPKDPSCRIWELVTTTDMLTEDAILNVINSHSMIKRYAYINHNKDIYTSDSIDKIKSQIKEKNPQNLLPLIMEVAKGEREKLYCYCSDIM